MPKIDVNKVAEILKNNEIDPKLLRQIVERVRDQVQCFLQGRPAILVRCSLRGGTAARGGWASPAFRRGRTHQIIVINKIVAVAYE